MQTMTDKELLELAAKAAGITPINVTEDGVVYGESVMECDYWNPLTDDGPALRLAVKLEIGINPYAGKVVVWSEDNRLLAHEKYDTDEEAYAATRRAIVRAAAQIGKAST